MKYNLINKEDLELWFGKARTWLIYLFSELKVKSFLHEEYETLSFKKHNITFLEFNKKSGVLWCSYQNLFLDLYIKFDIEGSKIKEMIKQIFELIFEIIPIEIKQTMRF